MRRTPRTRVQNMNTLNDKLSTSGTFKQLVGRVCVFVAAFEALTVLLPTLFSIFSSNADEFFLCNANTKIKTVPPFNLFNCCRPLLCPLSSMCTHRTHRALVYMKIVKVENFLHLHMHLCCPAVLVQYLGFTACRDSVATLHGLNI